MTRPSIYVLLLLFACQPAAAMESLVKVTYDQGHYKVDLNAHIQAPPEQVFLLLIDFNRLDRLSKTIRSSNLIKVHKDGRLRVLAKLRGCFLFFCRRATMVADVTIHRFGDITMKIVPELSDFKYGEARWQLIPHVDGTHLIYTADMVPRFRGRFFIKRQLRKSAEQTVKRLEQLANNNE